MKLAARLHSRALRAELRSLAALEEAHPTHETQRARQLELLNRSWADTRVHVPRYAELSGERALPERWDSLEHFAEQVPATSRETLQSERERLTSTVRPPELWGATGGSTAQPIQIPRWSSEVLATRPNAWLGRSWYGVEPDDRLFLLWGHSHLLGSGWRGWLNARRRRVEDALLGYRRFSAYDIRDAAMRDAVRSLLAFQPDYVLGYSVALDRLARAAAPERSALRDLGLKVVIATAEGFPYPDSAERLADAFGCPVAMEYGAVEALGVAYTHPEGGYRLFWNSYLAEAERSGEAWTLRLTSLFPRSMPLVRYEIGDEVVLPPGSPDRVVGFTHFERLLGRCNDYVELPDGSEVHSEAFSHAVRPCAAVRGYQVVQQGDRVELHVIAAEDLPGEQLAGLRERLAKIHPQLEEIPVSRVEALAQTTAGKTPMILRRAAA